MQFRRIVLTLATLAVAALVAAVILRSQPGPISATGVASVTAGLAQTCLLTESGGVQCWGGNFRGQLGDGTTIESTTPVDVLGLASGAAAIDTVGLHVCAVTTTGGVKCWGNNDLGQLGDGTMMDRSKPVDVLGLESGVAAVSGGIAHTCAVTTAGGVLCWGLPFGNMPVVVAGLESGVAAVDAGFHTCAVTTTGGVKCWGSNNSGQLGDGTTTDSPTPVDVLGLTDAVGIAVASSGSDSHTCALTESGGVKCWGNGGLLGADTTEDCDPDPENIRPCSTVPLDVTGLESGVASVVAGAEHTCARTEEGAVKCWGDNSHGQLGDGTTTDRPIPVGVSGLTSGVAVVSAGNVHTCAFTTAGGIKCWGGNIFGQLGTTTTGTCPILPCSTTPVDVPLGPKPTPVPTATPCPTGQVPDNGGCAAPTKTPTPTPTPCPTAKVPVGGGCGTPAPTPTPKLPDGDTDGDTIPNGSDPDDDNDGCTDVKELAPKALAAAGGGRDPHNFWDFFDVWTEPGPAKDLRVDGFDIAAVAPRFGSALETPLTKEEAFAEALTPPTDTTGYHAAFDRDSPEPGENVWNLRPPNGNIDGFDIAFVVVQFGHTCL